jgi:putative two-component system response regulator
MSAELGLRTGMTPAQAEDLRFAGMLHDVGKLHLPDSVLLKRGPLTRAEWALVKQHTIWGEKILGSTEGFELARRIARWHHENFDGSGYPDGLAGSRIPLEARIVRLADVVDALQSERPYKAAWDLERTLDEVRIGSGRMFDPELAKELLAMFEVVRDTRVAVPTIVQKQRVTRVVVPAPPPITS